jgi:hypothetical protein
MATVDAIGDLTGLGKAEQLAALRRSMAAIPGRRDHAPTEPVDASLFRASQPTAPPTDERPLSGPVRSRTLRTIPTNPCHCQNSSRAVRWPAERPSRSPVPDRSSSVSSLPPVRPATTSH